MAGSTLFEVYFDGPACAGARIDGAALRRHTGWAIGFAHAHPLRAVDFLPFLYGFGLLAML
jgi:hypothetical protein